MYTDDNGNIFKIRGDTEENICIYMVDDSSVIVPFVTGDTVHFTVKESVNDDDSDAVIHKEITTFDIEGKAYFDMTNEDTVDLDFKSYYYDVQVDFSDLTKKTIITPKQFVVTKEVYHG